MARYAVRGNIRSRVGRFAIGLLASSLTLVWLTAVVPVCDAWAEKTTSQKKVKRKKRRKTYTLGPLVFKRMSVIHQLIFEEKFAETLPLLDKLVGRRKLPEHDKAIIYETYGYVYSSQSLYAKSAKAFEVSLATGALPDTTLSNMRYNLAQLYLAEEEFQKAISHLERWMREVSNPLAQAYYLLGAAHAQVSEIKESLSYIEKAVAKSSKFKESWWQLLLSLHFELKHYREAVEVLVVLIEHQPKKSYLQQLQGLYSELGDEKKALAVMELSYLQGYLKSDNELRNLSHLYLYHEVPNLAAQVMVQGMADGTIESDRKAWELLGDSWLHAREYKRALEPLRKAAELSEDGDAYMKLARVYLEDQDWAKARGTIESALAKGELDDPGDAHLMLGISNAKVKRFTAARIAFKNAAKNKGSKKSAISWLRHLEDLEKAAERDRAARAR